MIIRSGAILKKMTALTFIQIIAKFNIPSKKHLFMTLKSKD